MGARMLVTKTGRPAFGRWAPTSGRPPVVLLVLVVLLILLAIAAGPAAGATVTRYAEEIRLARDGSAAVTLDVDLSGAPGEAVRLPFGHAKADLATLRVVGAVSGRIETLEGGLPVLVVTLGPQTSPLEVRVTVPRLVDVAKASAFGNRVLSHELVNATSLSCGRYEGTFLVPEGFRVNTIVETVPAESENAATRPYEVVRVDGRDGLRLTEPSFDPAKRVAAKVRFKPAAHSPLFPGLLLAAGALYLYRFRDLAGGAR